jgi:hypothetical protein
MPPSNDAPGGPHIAVVSANQETLDDLEGYLRDVGVSTLSGRHLGVVDELSPSVAVLVLFPDDFLRQEVIAILQALAACRPRLLLVLVTRDAARYELALPKTEHLLLMPRPVWAWAIHDAIRPYLVAGSTKRKAPSVQRQRELTPLRQ